MIVEILAKEEGFRAKPYHWSEGYPTIGYGQKIGPKGTPLDNYDFEIPEVVARLWLKLHVTVLERELSKAIPVYRALTQARRDVLTCMAYQLGVSGVLKFKNMLAALEERHYAAAAREMLDSKWARQTPARARRMATMMRTGEPT